jgi:hypothetical protein
MRMAVKSPCEPSPSVRKLRSLELNLEHQEDDGRDRRARDGFLLQALSEVVGNREAGDDGEKAEGGRHRDLQQLAVGGDRRSQPPTGR